MKTKTEVIIAGAGPVGLLLATELSRDGVDVLLVDPMESRSFFSKALGVSARSLEIFDDLGFLHDAIDRGVWLDGISSFTNGVPSGAMDIPADLLPFGSLSLAQFETERLIESCLRRHGGSVFYGWALTDFRESEEGVETFLTGPNGEARTVHCRWLAGCDGAHSKVRSLLGVPFEGDRYPQTFVLADVEVEWDLPRGRMYRLGVEGAGQQESHILAAVPVHSATGRRYRLSTVVPDSTLQLLGDNHEMTSLTLEQVISVMSPLLPEGTRLSSLQWSSVYRVSHRLVSEYSRGRVFLAGDAAHIHPPVGGQGMNTGLQDAHNLAWKLALAVRDIASPSLLDSYSAERHPVGLDVVQSTSHAMNEVLARRTPLPGMKETQLLIGYRDSKIVRDERADAADAPLAAGDRAPDAGQLRRRFVGQPFRLHELLGKGRHVLLGYEDGRHGFESLAQILVLLRSALGEKACGFAIAAAEADVPNIEDLPQLIDVGGDFAGAFAASPGMVWLIRPDGHIGWCSKTPSCEGLMAYLQLIITAAPLE